MLSETGFMIFDSFSWLQRNLQGAMKLLVVLYGLLVGQCLCLMTVSRPGTVEQQDDTHLICALSKVNDSNSKLNPPAFFGLNNSPKRIQKGKTINVTMKIEEPGGSIAFRVCKFLPKDVPRENCHTLYVRQGESFRSLYNSSEAGEIEIQVYVPSNLTCKLCVLEFIQGYENHVPRSDEQETYQTCGHFITTGDIVKRQAENCYGTGDYITLPGIDGWCQLNCALGFCPGTHCSCVDQAWPADEEYRAESSGEGEIRVEITSEF